MKTKYLTPAFLLTIGASAFADTVLFQSDFENSMATVGAPPAVMDHGEARPARVTAASDKLVAGASPESEVAYMIAGAEGEKHSWKPAADISLNIPAEATALKIAFKVRNVSLDVSTFGIQVASKDGNSYKLYQSLVLQPSNLRVTGTGRHLFKSVTAGVDSLWHTIEWTFPLPGKDGKVTVVADGVDQGTIDNQPKSDTESINNVRLWLTTKRGADSKFYLDDIKITAIGADDNLL